MRLGEFGMMDVEAIKARDKRRMESDITAYRTFIEAATNTEDERARRRFLCQNHLSKLPFNTLVKFNIYLGETTC